MANPKLNRRIYDNIYTDGYQTFETAIGVSVPAMTDTNSLFRQTYTTEDATMSNMKNLLLTRRGERYQHPDFGTGLHELLFEQITDVDEFETLIRQDLLNAIQTWLPYVVVTQLDVTIGGGGVPQSEREHATSIRLRFTVNNQGPINREVVIFISDAGRLTVL